MDRGSNMENTKALDIKVGIFISIGVIILLGSILVFGGKKSFLTDYQSYYGKLTTSQGINNGSVISLAGVVVGNVHKVDFVEGSNQLILTMYVETRYASRITTNARFSVKTQGALGDKYIFIDPGLATDDVLSEFATIQPSDETDIFDVISSKGDQFGRAADVIVEIHKLLSLINADGRSAKLMDNLVSSSENLKLLLAESRTALQDFKGDSKREGIQSTLARLSSILKKVDSGDGTLGALINDSALHERLMSLVGETPRNSYLKPLIRKTIRSRDTKSP